MIDPSRARRILAGTAASVFAIAGAAGTVAVLGTAPALAAGHGAAHHAPRSAASVQVSRVAGGAVRAATTARAPGGHKIIVNCFEGRRTETSRPRKLCLRPSGR
jgi:hypothetical protein